ncbi:MAG TPA: hypothetical protein PK566_04430 [Pseudobacteroides sp.]|nr:hypothetical protein [Pseudobacteroides sp.]
MVSNNSGIAEVILDGKLERTVDLYNSQSLSQQIIFQKQHLDRGNHSIQIYNTTWGREYSQGCSNNYTNYSNTAGDTASIAFFCKREHKKEHTVSH